ncbi:hypothetical protein XcyCFBP4188_22050 [Xanthomonas hortorum pv. cynarae]|nr:hypothetical protein XcyCFBP4188_22050 [Xanthomonas hortorum pv. cynarae]
MQIRRVFQNLILNAFWQIIKTFNLPNSILWQDVIHMNFSRCRHCFLYTSQWIDPSQLILGIHPSTTNDLTI